MLIGDAETKELRSQSIGPGDPRRQGCCPGNGGGYNKPIIKFSSDLQTVILTSEDGSISEVENLM